MCNYLERTFDCQSHDVMAQVLRCNPKPERFSLQLKQRFDVKCFDYNHGNVTPYVKHMEGILQGKRFPSTYRFRPFNRPRPRDECIWSNQTLVKEVRDIMMRNWDYFRFCDECIGSPDELALTTPS